MLKKIPADWSNLSNKKICKCLDWLQEHYLEYRLYKSNGKSIDITDDFKLENIDTNNAGTIYIGNIAQIKHDVHGNNIIINNKTIPMDSVAGKKASALYSIVSNNLVFINTKEPEPKIKKYHLSAIGSGLMVLGMSLTCLSMVITTVSRKSQIEKNKTIDKFNTAQQNIDSIVNYDAQNTK